MSRYKTQQNGYRFDKFIFWGFTLFCIIIVGSLIYINGIESQPYFKCKIAECPNPFYSELTHKCSYAFGFIKCKIKHDSWMDKKLLPKGEYGKKNPYDNFSLMLFSGLILAFILNHLIHNRGKPIMLDNIKKLERRLKKFK